MTAHSGYIAYADETGDHGLKSFDPHYPLFGLTFCVFRVDDYIARVVPSFQRIKFKHFGHDMIVFHEREIHKRLPPFEFLADPVRRGEFMADLNAWVADSSFVMIAVVIRKPEFNARHGGADNPYHHAMRLGLDRVSDYLRSCGAEGATRIVFEARGGDEDADLRREFYRVCGGENGRGEPYPFHAVFPHKQVNSTGLQLADLTARPVGRHVISPTQENRAYAVIKEKMLRGADGEVDGCGLICYP